MITLGSLCATPQERRHFVRGIFGVQLIFCGIASMLAVAGTAVYVSFRHSAGALGFLLPFASAVVAFLMQDWLRRYYFTVGKARGFVVERRHQLPGPGGGAVLSVVVTPVDPEHGALVHRRHIGRGIRARRPARAPRLYARRNARSLAPGARHLHRPGNRQPVAVAGVPGRDADRRGCGRGAGRGRRARHAEYRGTGQCRLPGHGKHRAGPRRRRDEARRNRARLRVSLSIWSHRICGAACVLFGSSAVLRASFLSFFYGRQLHAYAGVLDLQMLYFLLTWPIRQVAFLFRTIKHTRPILIGSVIAAVVSLAAVYPAVRGFGAARHHARRGRRADRKPRLHGR